MRRAFAFRVFPAALAITTALSCALASLARASLTTSEQAQIKGFVAGGDVANAARARALVARPDLSVDEVAAVLSDALVPVGWTEPRAAFFRELVFGGASASARPELVVGVVRALCARADAVYARSGADLDAHPDAALEVSRLYAFLERQVASAGHPQGDAHDPSAGIPASAYDAAAVALADHVQRNARWLRPDAPVGPLVSRLRGALEIAIYEMTNDSPTRRVDAADRIGLRGARRAFLTELGVLVLDAGKADDARVAKVRALVGRLPSAHAGVEAIAFGEPSAGLSSRLPSRGPILGVPAPLEATQAAMGYVVRSEEATPGPLDLPLFLLAYELSLTSLPRALDNRRDLRVQLAEDCKRGALGLSAMTAEQTLAGAMAQLLTDAPRAVDVAFGRWLRGQPESAALLSDAMGALAAFAPPGNAVEGLVLPLTRPRADGDLEPLLATRVHLLPNGAVSGFTLGGHRMELVRGAGGAVVLVKADGARVTLAALPTARVPLEEGNSWSGDGLAFARLLGAPRASVAPGPRVRLVSGGADALDAIATPSPGDDYALDLDLQSHGEVGVMLRASAIRGGYLGVSLVVDGSGSPAATAELRLRAGAGAETSVGSPVSLPADGPYHVHAVLRGSTVEVTIATQKLTARLPPTLAHGDVALRVAEGAALEASSLRLRP